MRTTTARVATERQTYSIDEAAKLIGVGRTTLHEATNNGQIPCIRVGHRKLISRKILEALLEKGLHAIQDTETE